jgi:hypothetical protein|tara:strand:- start:464 stop:1075 length:612 start_codon:yes stop_codon:yes gene_type:complete
MKLANITAIVNDIHKSKLSEESFAPNWSDLNYLYETVIETEPVNILEYGSGYSTLAMWAALDELTKTVHKPPIRPCIMALETDPYWYVANRRRLMDHAYPDGVENKTVLFDIIWTTVRNYSLMGLKYNYNPMMSPDFVYVDGPPLVGDRTIVFDVFEIHPLPLTFVVDGRNDQVALMTTMLGIAYDKDQNDKDFRTTFRRKEQ